MATFTKLSSGSWRVQVRRKGRYVSDTFLRRDDARRWAIEAERQVDRGEAPNESRIARLTTFGELIDLHIDDMCDVGKAPLRSKVEARTRMLLIRDRKDPRHKKGNNQRIPLFAASGYPPDPLVRKSGVRGL